MYVYTLEDFGSSGFTEITAITIHRIFYQASRDSRALKMVDHGVTKISLPPSLYLWFSEVVFFPFYCPDIVTAAPCPRTLDETNFGDDDLIPKGLFTRRGGCPCARVTPARKLGVKVSSGLQANCTGRVILSPGSTLAAFLTRFIMRDILCNGPRFEIILKFSMENTLIHEKNRKFYQCIQKIIFGFSVVYNYAQKLDNAVLVTHDGGKLT